MCRRSIDPVCIATVLLLSLQLYVNPCRTQEIDTTLSRSTAMDLHEKFTLIRQQEYGNVHFTLRFTEKAARGYHQEKVIRYWARDNKYFRVDEETIVNGDHADRTKLIIRPEGYVRLCQTAHGEAITNYGTTEQGKELLEVQTYFCASTRCYRFINGECPWGHLDSVEYTNGLSESLARKFTPLVIKADEGRLGLTSKLQVNLVGTEDSHSTTYNVSYDKINGIVLSYTQLDYSEGDDYKSFLETKQYDMDRMKHIPSRIVTKINSGESDWSERNYSIESIDWSPVPMGIFSFEAHGLVQGNVWQRRTIILGTALAFIAAFVAYRLRTRR